ncbi:pitrilysin family protein [Anaerolentibacter hominis]|uniref:M16 family metallopeptidase n=1 Tax=Anaerolentibacter hominis TaxID=3079009 RepID=UPI0031B839BC
MVSIKTLPNEITVVMEPMEYLKSVSCGIWVRTGSANETAENNGISHMIEHMLFKGTGKRSALNLANDMARIGGNMNAYTEKECTAFYVTTLTEHLGEALEILGDMICGSVFSEEDVEKEKGVVLEEIDLYDDSPDDMVHEMLQKTVWPDHPLGFLISGEKSIVSGFTRRDLVDFWQTHYCGSNMVISMAGKFNPEQAVEWIIQSFGGLKPGMRIPAGSPPVYHRNLYLQQKDIGQLHMNLAFPGIGELDEDRYALTILNSILGGTESSRLFQQIREERGLTYSIFSYGSSYQSAGLLQIDAVLNPEKADVVYTCIEDTIARLIREGVSGEEVLCTKEQLKTELMIGNESTRSRMNRNGKEMLVLGRLTGLNDTVRRLEEVTEAEVSRLAERYLDYSRASLALIGDLSDGENQLTKRLRVLYN